MNEKELLIMKILRRKNVLIEDFNTTKNAPTRNQHRWMKPRTKMKHFFIGLSLASPIEKD